MIQTVFPKRIVESGNVTNTELLLSKRELCVGIYDENFAEIPRDGGFIVLDFGKEMRGGIRILTARIPGNKHCSTIRLRFGESLAEVYAELGEKNTTNNHAPRDFYYTICDLSDLKIGDTGYRFVRIDFMPSEEPVSIKAIVGTNNILRMSAKYSYKGNDKRIKKIFDVAKRTVDLCASSGYVWDGIKRDRLVWIGDLYPEILSLCTLYGRVPAVERSLNFERTRPKYQGKWMCSLRTYSMWWVSCVCEYYFLTGAKDFIKDQLEYIDKQIELFNSYVDEDGTMRYEGLFVDWPTHNREDEYVGSKFINILAARKAKRLYEELGMDTAQVDKLLEKLLRGDMTVKSMKQVIGLKYYALGEISDAEYAMLIEGGARGLSTFMSYFILGTIASRDPLLATEIMKEYYGAMLDKGATTFWEDFDMDWVKYSGRIDRLPRRGEKDIHGDYGKFCYLGFRHSLCHAWSSGVIKFIQENCQ